MTSEGSRRGATRRRIRLRVREAMTLRLVEYGGPDLVGLDSDADLYRVLAKWIADNLPDYVVDAIEASDAARQG